MIKKALTLPLIIILILTSLAMPALGKLGVGINVGKIEVNEPLLAGGAYDISKISVINTGDETSDYTMDVSFLQDQKDLKPEKSWFRFKPENFELEPGEAKSVSVEIVIPLEAKAGDYFAFIEGKPVPKDKGLSIGVAAAAKFNFTVESSTLFWSIYNRITALLTDYSPFSYILIGLVVLIIIWLILRRYLSFGVKLERKDKDK